MLISLVVVERSHSPAYMSKPWTETTFHSVEWWNNGKGGRGQAARTERTSCRILHLRMRHRNRSETMKPSTIG